MKRFVWPLQRLLDVTTQRELALRAALLGLSRRMARLRQQIIGRRAALRDLLHGLGREALARRLPRQEVFLRCSVWEERRIGRLNEDLAALRAERESKTAEFVKVKRSRETLERLREEARQRHAKQRARLEQKQLDESANASFARRLLHGAPAG
jgi:flagellar biosynthesis chaperone FliJ